MTREEHVSVINPTYYRNERLAEAIESVLRQNYLTRVFIIDDSGENHAESGPANIRNTIKSKYYGRILLNKP
jgi:GT2 family glycosyltransferase